MIINNYRIDVHQNHINKELINYWSIYKKDDRGLNRRIDIVPVNKLTEWIEQHPTKEKTVLSIYGRKTKVTRAKEDCKYSLCIIDNYCGKIIGCRRQLSTAKYALKKYCTYFGEHGYVLDATTGEILYHI